MALFYIYDVCLDVSVTVLVTVAKLRENGHKTSRADRQWLGHSVIMPFSSLGDNTMQWGA